MNCKSCGVVIEWAGINTTYIDAEQSPFCGNTSKKHEPASPVAQPEKCIAFQVKEELNAKLDNALGAVAQSGAGGEPRGITDTYEEGDENPNNIRFTYPPSSPSRQAPATPMFSFGGLIDAFDLLPHDVAEQIDRLGVWINLLRKWVEDYFDPENPASPTGGAEPPFSNQYEGDWNAAWRETVTQDVIRAVHAQDFDKLDAILRSIIKPSPAAAEPSAWPSDVPADGMGAMNLLTNFWTGDLKGLTKEGARIVDSLVAHVTKGMRDEVDFFQREMGNFRRNRDHRIVQLEGELAESNRLLELANAPEKALEDALTVAESLREQLEKVKRPAQESSSG